MRPLDLPPAERYAHGTRARYVAGCRCSDCRAANVARYHERQARAKAAAAEISAPPTPAPQTWTAPDGTKKVRVYARACPGVDGLGCRTHSHLRKDSKGGVCRRCRELLVWNGLVGTERVRGHLQALSGLGLGYKAVADAAGVARSVVGAILSGAKRRIRKDTRDRILAVDPSAVADHALVPARPTWTLIGELRRWGLTKGEIALRLGRQTPALQLRRRRVLARTALAVEKLHRAVQRERAARKACEDCALWGDCRGRFLGTPACVVAKEEAAA